MLSRRAALVAAILALSFAAPVEAPVEAHEATKGGVTAIHPWARATPGGATVGAAYLEIAAGKGVADRLIGASSPVAGRAEIHTHMEENGVMKMRRVDSLALKPGASIVLQPKGDHIMLVDLKGPLKEGDLVKIRLEFEKAGAIELEATVEPVGAMGPHGMNHQPGHDHAGSGDASKPDMGHGHH